MTKKKEFSTGDTSVIGNMSGDRTNSTIEYQYSNGCK